MRCYEARVTFTSPYNWCDGNCARCPVANECPVRKLELQRAWVHTARHEDPNDPQLIFEHAERDMKRALSDIEEAAEEDGIDLSAPVPSEPISLAAARLYKSALAIVSGLAQTGDPEATQGITIFVQKSARISMFVSEGARAGDAWDADAIPNLLLLERLRAGLGPRFEGAADDLKRAIDTFDRSLAPLLASVGDEPRRELADLIAQNAAPSPFCVSK
jgi:hypothetical protein